MPARVTVKTSILNAAPHAPVATVTVINTCRRGGAGTGQGGAGRAGVARRVSCRS